MRAARLPYAETTAATARDVLAVRHHVAAWAARRGVPADDVRTVLTALLDTTERPSGVLPCGHARTVGHRGRRCSTCHRTAQRRALTQETP